MMSLSRGAQLRTSRIALYLVTGLLLAAPVEAQVYVGVLGGLSTLSGDARSVLSQSSTAFSSYDPKDGGSLELLIGKHLSDYFTVQVNYVWNGNGLTLTSAAFSGGTQVGYRQSRTSSQHGVIADVLVYFRGRESRLRPFLSLGTGLVHFSSSEERIEQIIGTPSLSPQRFGANMIALHVPVGMDVKIGKGWAFRYTFSETLSANPISDRLSPPGQHSLKNFQNLFGLIRQF